MIAISIKIFEENGKIETQFSTVTEQGKDVDVFLRALQENELLDQFMKSVFLKLWKDIPTINKEVKTKKNNNNNEYRTN